VKTKRKSSKRSKVAPVQANGRQRDPGDFQADNHALIVASELLRVDESHWKHEAAVADHQQRRDQAAELAQKYAEIRELQKQYYRQWQI
jgi:hypothetical protein